MRKTAKAMALLTAASMIMTAFTPVYAESTDDTAAVDWEKGEDLVDDGIIDSMDVVTIISEITDAYDIEIPSEEMEPENFNSAKAIYAMIQRLEEE